MKYFFGTLILLCITSTLQSQSLIGVTGNHLTGNGIQVDYAVGEVCISTITSTVSTTEITQGYLQPIINAIANPISPFRIPNAFSPNGDNINDTWFIPGLDAYKNSRVTIFDRYGRITYNSTGIYTPWDGNINGKKCAVGIYYYIIEPETAKKSYSGWLLLMR